MSLPIAHHSEEILAALAGNNRLILSAPTGSGKSTGVPPLLYRSGQLEGKILVIQPRRIAARLLAKRVAQTLECTLGQEVGYMVRFDVCASARTKILFMTDGVLLRELAQNPTLKGISLLIFDEFHERRLDTDLALGYCRELQQTRPDLKLIVMSATLAAESLQEYLAQAQRIQVEGRSFPVTIQHRAPRPRNNPRSGRPETLPLWQQVGALAKELAKNKGEEGEGGAGDWLIFLPGVFEIQKTITELSALSALRHFTLYPLYSGLPPDQQLRAIEAPGPKIVVATNVAETSLTIATIKTVIDTGWARESRYDPQRGMDSLLVRKISQAAAEQRAGRAGRTSAGHCYRLWSESDHRKREPFQPPETLTKDLTSTLLLLAELRYRLDSTLPPENLPVFPWLTAPTAASSQRSFSLLRSLGALDAAGALTPVGRSLQRFPLEPRLSRLLLAGHEYDCLPEALFIAASLQGEPLIKRSAGLSVPRGGGRPAPRSRNRIGDFEEPEDRSSFAALWRVFHFAQENQFQSKALKAFGLSGRAARELSQSLQQLTALAQKAFPASHRTIPDFTSRADAVARAVGVSFGERLSIKLGAGTLSCRMLGGRKGLLEDSLVARSGTLFFATHLHEVEGREVLTHLSHLVGVELEELQAWHPEALHRSERVAFEEATKKFVVQEEYHFHHHTERLIISRQVSTKEPGPVEVGVVLAEMIADGKAELPLWNEKVHSWIARLNQLAEWRPELELPGLNSQDEHLLKQSLCAGVTKLRELKELDPWPLLHDWLSPLQHSALKEYAPLELTLENGTHVKVRYSAQQAPTIAVKVQKLYGVEQTPTLCEGEVPLRVEILAPNQRPWQITEDLANFWQRGYPQMKKDLAGRYPKHNWR